MHRDTCPVGVFRVVESAGRKAAPRVISILRINPRACPSEEKIVAACPYDGPGIVLLCYYAPVLSSNKHLIPERQNWYLVDFNSGESI